jgi:hypothetical protein
MTAVRWPSPSATRADGERSASGVTALSKPMRRDSPVAKTTYRIGFAQRPLIASRVAIAHGAGCRSRSDGFLPGSRSRKQLAPTRTTLNLYQQRVRRVVFRGRTRRRPDALLLVCSAPAAQYRVEAAEAPSAKLISVVSSVITIGALIALSR